MAERSDVNPIEESGKTAGLIWHNLNENGSVSLSKLAQNIPVQRDLVMQGIGWLAREDRIALEKTSRGRTIRLR